MTTRNATVMLESAQVWEAISDYVNKHHMLRDGVAYRQILQTSEPFGGPATFHVLLKPIDDQIDR